MMKTADANHRGAQPGTQCQETECGLGSLKGVWLQPLASKKTYVLIFGLIGMAQFALGSYFVATISTLEKRFKIPSRTSGIISSCWDVGGFFSTLLFSYLGSRGGHRTRWVAVGTIFVSFSCFIRLLPHIMFGPGIDAMELTEEYSFLLTNSSNNRTGEEMRGPLCGNGWKDEEDCAHVGSTSLISAAILMLAQLCLGVGSSTYYTLGISYMDDNTKKNKTPMLLAIWTCLRMLGPMCGFSLASYALELYVDPTLHPTITSDDPRWIGAWWFGWTPLGVIIAILGIALAFFPKILPRAAQRKVSSAIGQEQPPEKPKSFTDFKVTIRRLVKNRTLVFNSMSSVCFMFGFIGYWVFMPKYMETQFRQSAARASLITGAVGLMCTAAGMMVSGLVISKFKPRARYIAAWNVVVELLDVAARVAYVFLGCPIEDLHGSWTSDSTWSLTQGCNAICECDSTVKYSPVCGDDGLSTFYSACHAGCTTQEMINGSWIYGNCSCIGPPDSPGYAVDGACTVNCLRNFTIFIFVECMARFFSSTGRAGNTIIQFRCVDEEDKAVSIGFTESLLTVLALIPGPIVYGIILDSSCMVWGMTCGVTGNCWLYDGESLRYTLNFTAVGFMMAGTVFDIFVWYNVKTLKIYDDNIDETGGNRRKAGGGVSGGGAGLQDGTAPSSRRLLQLRHHQMTPGSRRYSDASQLGGELPLL